MANVFVSHRSADIAVAERLAEDIRAAGHDVWLDAWNINLGDSIVERMNEGLTSASHVLLCWSSAGNLAPWFSREWLSALARQLNGHHIRLLPVLLPGSTPPALLADIKYADLAADYDQALNAILEELARTP